MGKVYWIDVLAQYNAEKNRGIEHTRGWKDAMKRLQSRFNNGIRNDDILVVRGHGTIVFKDEAHG